MRQYEATTNVVTREHFDSFKQEITSSIVGLSETIKSSTDSLQKTLQHLSKGVAALEDTCKSQAQGAKRKHDDQDDPDHHEGENKRQKVSEAIASTGMESSEGVAQDVSTEQVGGSAGQNLQMVVYKEPVVHSITEPMVEKPKVVVPINDEIRAAADDFLIELICIDSHTEEKHPDFAKLKIKEEIEDMFNFSDEEIAEEGNFDRETLPESPKREQSVGVMHRNGCNWASGA